MILDENSRFGYFVVKKTKFTENQKVIPSIYISMSLKYN